ncbi:uncharacterized protein RAG0_08091 [Rhynchosporium agropyri]|uniref:DUF1740-domain-containing protein n=1 Tax=Rhynchosporium agropyri TaxID=914238 RepID=A0A1E1KP29_9HELO|nr:uncharacterized protein RAG0_08091 [Rhynchosporium agropyri]
MSAPKATVPKFGSFKPKAALTSEPENHKADTLKDVKERTRSKDEKEGKRRHHKRHRPKSQERIIASVERETGSASELEPVNNSSPDIFVIDRKGDLGNLVYGSVHRYNVPPFYRYGSGYVLGASSDLKIDRNHGDSRDIILRFWRIPRSREKYVFSKIEKERPRLLKIRPEILAETSSALDSDFVLLQAQKGKKRKRSTGNESSDDEEQRDYRSICGKPKDNGQPADGDLQYLTESDSSGSDAGRNINLDSSIRQRNVELSRNVEKCPQDISTWLNLIDHQDVLMKAGDGRRRITSAETKSTADIKIHMYEKALEKVQSLEDREKLLLGLMAEGTKIWEVNKQSDRWEQISEDNIDSLLLWTSYLNFKQSTFTTFRYDDLREVFLKRIRLLLETVERSTEDARGALYQQLIYVILRLTLFIREAGYTELAVAIWQGLLELNFNAPNKKLSKRESMESFKEFWESEVSRVGEGVALGWNSFVVNSTDIEIPDTVTDKVDASLSSGDIFRTWSVAERIRMKCSQTPARTMDEVAEDDPYRVIMFTDIEDFLIQLPRGTEGLLTSCIEAFLLFCRLPPMTTPNSQTSRKWANDSFVRDELLECSSNWIKNEFFSKCHQNNDPDISRHSFLHTPFPSCVSTPELLFGNTFAGNDYFGSPPSQDSIFQARYSGDNGPLSISWIRNTLKQIVQAHFTEDLAEYYLAFEFHHSPTTIKKIARGLLKQHPSCLRLYNAYAMIEWSRGNKDIANGVFSTALSMHSNSTTILSNSDKEQANDAITLWRNSVWLNLEAADNTSALRCLLSIPDGKPDPSITLSPMVQIRAKQYLVSTRDFLCSAGDFSRAVLYTECLALLTYLTAPPTSEPQSPTQGSILPALAVYQTFTNTLHARSQLKPPIAIHTTTMHQSLARLLIHHIKTGPFRPSLLRSTLTPLLTTSSSPDSPHPHPDSHSHAHSNSILLSLYARTETHLHLSQRVRTLLQTHTLTPPIDTLSSRLFSIKYELETGTVHSARAAFEHAVASDVGRGAAGLWKLYVLFSVYGFPEERRKGKEKERGRGVGKGKEAKDVWYRALRACPWAKELYVLGMEEFGGGEDEDEDGKGLAFEDLRGTWRVMGEKECRVHVDLEDAFEEIAELGTSGGMKRVSYE